MKITEHFDSDEFACHDGTPYPLGETDDTAPGNRTWRETRLLPLCLTLEAIRANAACGPLHVNSGFRTIAFDQKIYDASAKDGSVATPQGSQHPKGRAADVVGAIRPIDLHEIILVLFHSGRLPHLGGLGLYPHFVHVDVRPRPGSAGGASDGHLARWQAGRLTNVP